MNRSQLVIVAAVVCGCGALLTLLLAWVLPLIVVLPDTPARWWAYLAPTGGALAALLVLLRGRHPADPSALLGELPRRLTLAFTCGTLPPLALALLLGDTIQDQRLLTVPVAAPALLVAVAMVLRSLLRRPLSAALAADRSEQGGPASLAVPAIRPAIVATAVALAATTSALVGVHTYYRALANEEQLSARHRREMLRLTRAQLDAVPAAQRRGLLRSYPADGRGTPLLLDPDGRLVEGALGYPAGTRFEVTDDGYCRHGERRWRCLVGPGPEGTMVAVAQTANSRDHRGAPYRLGRLLALMSLAIVAFAALLGWAAGTDAARDFRAITTQLQAMAHGDHLELGQPLTVTSLDAVGDLIIAAGKLRHRLAAELESYQRALEKTREAERQKTRFIADVSHELRTPLNTLCGFSQLLLEGVEGPLTAEQHEDVRVIHEGGKQLLALVNDVLDLSLIESGRMKLTLEPVQIEEICAQVVLQNEPLLRERKKLRLAAIVDPDLPALQADPRRLRQVLQNLVSNALKFTAQGEITIRARSEGQQMVIDVEDTGVGISAVELPRIFEEYRQAGAISARRGGTGLGLAICKRIVETHQGRITVDSEMGRGTRFTIVLPLDPTTAFVDQQSPRRRAGIGSRP